MEILKHGERPDNRVQFRCHDCGCVYIANRDEYTIQQDKNNDMYYVSFCPECVSRNIADKTMADIKSGCYGKYSGIFDNLNPAEIPTEKRKFKYRRK